MKHLLTLVLVLLIGSLCGPPAMACSCFGPQTFCETLDPPYPDPQWWIPDAVVMAVKLADADYGADVKVVRSFAGELAVDQVIRVWGDCGLLCRFYVDGVNIGDTVLWAIQETDLSGNWGCGSELEQPQDFQLSVCGVYWLQYANGVVSGPITTTNANEEMELEEFEALVGGCLGTGVNDRSGIDPIVMQQGPGGTWLSLNDHGSASISILDAAGRSCFSTSWNGTSIGLNGLPGGVYVIAIFQNNERWFRKVIL